MDNRYTSRQQTAQAAMDVQDACNIRGVLKSAWDMACFIGAEKGNPEINNSPEMVLMVSKLASLIYCQGPDMIEFNNAWTACEELAKQPVSGAQA